MTSAPGGDRPCGDHDDETAALVAGYSEDRLVQAIAGHADDDLAGLITAGCGDDPVLELLDSSDDDTARQVASYDEEADEGGRGALAVMPRLAARLRGTRLLPALAAGCCAALRYLQVDIGPRRAGGR